MISRLVFAVKSFVTYLIVGAVVLSSCTPEENTSAVAEHVVEAHHFAGEPDVLFSSVGILTVSPAGQLFVLDQREARIHGFNSDGSGHVAFGRQGEGPGELQFPGALGIPDSTVRVADYATGRETRFSLTGSFLETADLPDRASTVVYGPRGHLAFLGSAEVDSIAAVYDPDGTLRYAAGTRVVEGRVVLDMANIKSEINSGRIPDVLYALSNNGVLDAAGGLWLIRSAAAEIVRYDARGRLQWERSYADLPEADQILERFFERNAAIDAPNSFAPLSYFRDAAMVDDKLWVLVAVPDDEPALVLVVDQDGVIDHRLRFPDAAGAGSLAIGPDAERAYFGVHTSASIMEAAILPNVK
jgi:hypothetical protein